MGVTLSATARTYQGRLCFVPSPWREIQHLISSYISLFNSKGHRPKMLYTHKQGEGGGESKKKTRMACDVTFLSKNESDAPRHLFNFCFYLNIYFRISKDKKTK
jgi:hypothetical protein